MMKYYTKLFNKIKGNVQKFYQIFANDLSKSKYKFLIDMLNGILASKSVNLFCIAKTLNEKITIHNIIDRLSGNLSNFKANNRKKCKYVTLMLLKSM